MTASFRIIPPTQKIILRHTGIFFIALAAAAIGMFCNTPASAQQNVTASVNEFFRYGTGSEVQLFGQPPVNKEYLEDFTTAQINVGDFLVGMRYQVYDSSELYGQHLQGIQKRYIEYKKDGLDVRAGNVYGLFGRGLSLNLFENTSIYYDSGVDGLKMAYRADVADALGVDATAIAGTLTFTDFTNPNDIRVENYHLQAGEIGFSPHLDLFRHSHVAFSWVHATGVLPPPLPNLPNDSLDVTLPSTNIDLTTKDIEWYFEYAGKRTDVAYRPLNGTGGVSWSGAMYSAFTYTHPGFGATLEYKNYHFDVVNSAEQQDEITRTTKTLPFQNAPTLYKEQSYTLVTRVQHSIDFNDEVGFQLDGFWSPMEDLTINFNAAAASQHYAYTGIPGSQTAIPRSNTWLPDLDSAYSPFWELFGEVEYDFHDDSFIKVAFDRTVAIPVGTIIPEASTTFPMVKGEYSLGNGWGVNWDFENQWIHNPQTTSDSTAPKIFAPDIHTYFSQLISAGFTLSPYGGLTAIYEWSSQTDDISGRRNWFLIEGTFRIGSSNTFIISNGDERGGIRCSNGICRYINPFSGWRLIFTSQM